MSDINKCLARIRQYAGVDPVAAAIILGTGLGSLSDDVEDAVELAYTDLPGFPALGVSGHAGRLVIGTLEGMRVAMLQGREHYYERGRADAMRTAIKVTAELGASILVATNSAGSLRADAGPGSVMMITDHINFSGRNPLIGDTGDERFVDLSVAYDEELRDRLANAAASEKISLSQGVYVWFSGPSFETPAEIRAARVLGGDAVGMSTVPEVILARRLGLRVVALSMITNQAAGMGPPLDHRDTRKIAGAGSAQMCDLIRGLFRSLADDAVT